MSELLVNIAFPSSALRQHFTYRVSNDNTLTVFPGQRVVAPLRNNPSIGFVTEVGVSAPKDIALKTISEIIDPEPLIPPDLFRFLLKLSDYYLAPFGKTLSAAIPGEYSVQKNRHISAIDTDDTGIPENYRDLFNSIVSAKSISLTRLKHRFGSEPVKQGIKILKNLNKISETAGFSLPEHQPITRKQIRLVDNFSDVQSDILATLKNAPRQREIIEYLQQHNYISHSELASFSSSGIKALVEKQLVQVDQIEVTDDLLWEGIPGKEKNILLTHEQQQVVDTISRKIGGNRFAPFLIQGVTGSGKTEVYLKLIREAIDMGLSVLVLVPEITLTTHLASRFKGEFQEKIAIWHSQLNNKQRGVLWKNIRDKQYPIIIGARSAVLLPIQNLGLTIIDEEQDSSFKQREQDPRYHARDAALMRALESRAVVVLGSATPSLESLFNAATGKLHKLELKQRYSKSPAANIDIIDMKAEWTETGDYQNPISRQLKEKIAEKLARREQVLLLQNRRGYSSVLLCPDCGWTPKCRNCDISLTYHQKDAVMLCHYCNFSLRPPDICPDCQSSKFLYPGYGTQKVELSLKESFPNHEIVRLDFDSARKAGYSRQVMRDFESGRISIILGTQMIAKGLDFPNVTLVGVLNADIGLFMPDFRARERVFQLLYQVAGRAGRGDVQGEVLIQSFNPRDITIRFAMQQNFKKFTSLELNERNPINYPPFSRIAALHFSGLNEGRVATAANICTKELRHIGRKLEVLGPSPAPLKKIKNRYRYFAIIKSRKETDPNGTILRNTLKTLLNSSSYSAQSRQVRIGVDIDPLDLL